MVTLLFGTKLFMLSLLYRSLRTCCNGFRAIRLLGCIHEKGVCSAPFRFRCSRPARSQDALCGYYAYGQLLHKPKIETKTLRSKLIRSYAMQPTPVVIQHHSHSDL